MEQCSAWASNITEKELKLHKLLLRVLEEEDAYVDTPKLIKCFGKQW